MKKRYTLLIDDEYKSGYKAFLVDRFKSDSASNSCPGVFYQKSVAESCVATLNEIANDSASHNKHMKYADAHAALRDFEQNTGDLVSDSAAIFYHTGFNAARRHV